MVPIPATDLVSPIFTMWLTLLLMYAANCLADYSAAATLNAAYTADLRRGGWGAGGQLGRAWGWQHMGDARCLHPALPSNAACCRACA